MKKSKFWTTFTIGLLLLLGAFFLLGFGVDKETDTASLIFNLVVVAVFAIIGLVLVYSTGDTAGEGWPRTYLLDRMEYKKDIESRSKSSKKGKEGVEDVRLLLSKADRHNEFDFAKRFHLIPRDSLVDKNGKILEELPETFFARVSKKGEETLYYIYPTRTNKA